METFWIWILLLVVLSPLILCIDIESAKKGPHHSLRVWDCQKRLCGIQLDLPCVRLVRAGDSR